MKRVLPYDPWNFDAEVGDIMVDSMSEKAYRLYESRGRNKRDAGELTPVEIKKPGKRATLVDGKLVWEDKE